MFRRAPLMTLTLILTMLVQSATPVTAAVVTSPALFVAAHPDDETLSMSVAIAEHVAAGQDVHVLIVTDGEGSSAVKAINGLTTSPWWGRLHDPDAEGYTPLTAADLGTARVAEARRAVAQLASPGKVTIHLAHLADGGVSVADAKAAVLAVADAIAPGAAVRLKGHTYLATAETHPDHLAVGQALKDLSADDPARFGDRRHYVLPQHWGVTGLPGQSWDLPANADITARAHNAARAYGAWAPELGSYAIGWHSVPSYFATLDAAPKCLVHT